MAYLHLVIQLASIADGRVVERTPINGCSGANLNIAADRNAINLGDLDVVPGITIELKTKPICTDDNTGVNQAAVSDAGPMIQDNVRHQPRTFSNPDTFTNVAAGSDVGTCPNVCARPNHCIGANGNPMTQSGEITHNSRIIDEGHRNR